MTRIAILQMTAGIDPAANAQIVQDATARAARGGAAILFTPEMTGMIDRDRLRAASQIVDESRDPVLAAAQQAAQEHRIWLALGSLAVRSSGERWANRSYMIDDRGRIAARYDKMHMFDVALDSGERWQESSAFQPGEAATVVDTPVGRVGLTICYDIRFPALFAALGQAQCDVIAIPAAFTRPTGRDHWHVLQRARAIEASAFVVAAAQVGTHQDGRETYGHSLVIDPWGTVLLDMGGEAPGLAFAELEPGRIEVVRRQLPSLANRRAVAPWGAA